MPSLAQRVSSYIRKHKLLKPGDRVGAAVSGGADSVAMLRLLLELRRELGIVLSVMHFNHKLRGAESDADEQFVAELAQRHQLEFHRESGDVAKHGAESHLSLETAAREMRYTFFHRLLCEGRVNRIATAHTLDDQAETVLLKVARGAGTRGLAAIYPRLPVPGSQFSAPPDLAIVRPLLGIRRNALEGYLKEIVQNWRQDSSNRDLRHARNRVRHGILPRLERSLNPAVREALAETAEIARGEEEYWQEEVARNLPQAWSESERCLKLETLLGQPLALQRRLIRAAAESLGLRLEFSQVEEILEVASGSGRASELQDGWSVCRDGTRLAFATPAISPGSSSYEYRLPVPGEVMAAELNTRFATILLASGMPQAGEGCLLDCEAVGSQLSVRNWRPGDRIRMEHRKSPKKIKELLQEKHLTGRQRKLWPVVVLQNEVVWLRGFPPAAKFCAKPGRPAVLLQEISVLGRRAQVKQSEGQP